MSKQYLSVPVKYNTSETLQADDIKIPVEILVMHDQVNLNKSNFDFAVVDADITKESLKNIPILGYIKKVDGSDSKDFAGHEMEVVFKDGEFNITYLERPIGVIPESNNYEYVEKDGKQYVKVIGYIWQDYLNDGYEILQESPNKSVSMEIVVDAYEVRKDGIVDIKAYRYTGITVLGDNVLPGMQGANMQVIGQFSNDQKFSTEFYERVEKLNFELKNNTPLEGGENEQMSKEKDGEIMTEKLELLNKYNLTIETISFSIEELSLEEIETKINEQFALLASQKQDEMSNALRADKHLDRWGDECSNYSYVDHTDSEVFAWDRQNNWCLCGFTYSMSEDSIVIDFDSKKKKKFEIVDFIEGQSMETFTLFPQEAIDYALINKDKEFSSVNTEFEELKVKVSEYEIAISEHATKVSEFELEITNYESSKSTLTEQFNIVTEENKNLLEYKNNNELEIKQSQIDDIISDFESILGENEEFKVIKEKAMEFEVEALEKELYALEGKIKHAKVNKPAKKPQTFSRVSVDPEVNNDVTESYYGDAVKFIPKN